MIIRVDISLDLDVARATDLVGRYVDLDAFELQVLRKVQRLLEQGTIRDAFSAAGMECSATIVTHVGGQRV